MGSSGPSVPSTSRRDAALRAVLAAHERVLHGGEIVFEPGEPGDSLFVLRSGEVELSRAGAAGAHRLGRVGPGESFGELGALGGRARTLRATATRESRVLELDRATFEQMCLDEPIIAWRVIHALAARLDAVEATLAAGVEGSPLASFVRLLAARAEPGADGARIPGTLRQLADAAGLAMQDAYRIVQELIERRGLQLVDDELVAPDLDALGHTTPPA